MIFFQILIGLVPTFLISRLFLWLSKFWAGGYVRYAVVHAASGTVALCLAALGNADGGPLNWEAGLPYLASQAVVLVVDVLAYRGRIGKEAKAN